MRMTFVTLLSSIQKTHVKSSYRNFLIRGPLRHLRHDVCASQKKRSLPVCTYSLSVFLQSDPSMKSSTTGSVSWVSPRFELFAERALLNCAVVAGAAPGAVGGMQLTDWGFGFSVGSAFLVNPLAQDIHLGPV